MTRQAVRWAGGHSPRQSNHQQESHQSTNAKGLNNILRCPVRRRAFTLIRSSPLRFPCYIQYDCSYNTAVVLLLGESHRRLNFKISSRKMSWKLNALSHFINNSHRNKKIGRDNVDIVLIPLGTYVKGHWFFSAVAEIRSYPSVFWVKFLTSCIKHFYKQPLLHNTILRKLNFGKL